MRALALLGAMLALTGCLTTSATVTASNPHPDLPADYRRQIVDYMKTQMFAQIGGERLRAQSFEIADPHRNWSGYDVVCVRSGQGSQYGDFSTVRGYAFSNGKLLTFTGQIVSQYGSGVLVMAAHCGSEPVWRAFPEWNRT